MCMRWKTLAGAGSHRMGLAATGWGWKLLAGAGSHSLGLAATSWAGRHWMGLAATSWGWQPTTPQPYTPSWEDKNKLVLQASSLWLPNPDAAATAGHSGHSGHTFLQP